MKMTNDQIKQLASSAANKAIKHIQDKLGQKSGEFADVYFSDDRWHALVNILSDYVATEIMEGVK